MSWFSQALTGHCCATSMACTPLQCCSITSPPCQHPLSSVATHPAANPCSSKQHAHTWGAEDTRPASSIRVEERCTMSIEHTSHSAFLIQMGMGPTDSL